MTQQDIQHRIARLERERDRARKIHCPLVAAKFQRMIDKIKEEYHDKNM